LIRGIRVDYNNLNNYFGFVIMEGQVCGLDTWGINVNECG
jgi:hypothetical protein